MGRLEGLHLRGAGEAMDLKGGVPLLQQLHRPQPLGTGVVRKVHPGVPDCPVFVEILDT